MSAPEKFSSFPAVEEETRKFLNESDDEDESYTEEFLNKRDAEDERYTEDAGFKPTTMIGSLTEAKKNSPFAAWQPFIPSNWQDNSSQSLPAQPYWPFSSVQLYCSEEQSTQAEQPSTTNWCTQISSVSCSLPGETNKGKPP
jgi:hypothetical protein